MEKPNKQQYGFIENDTFDGEPSGWVYEGGEDAYYKAMKRWEFMQANGLGEEDMINDVTLPQGL